MRILIGNAISIVAGAVVMIFPWHTLALNHLILFPTEEPGMFPKHADFIDGVCAGFTLAVLVIFWHWI